MALGGGTFTTMNKPLPGTYINFVSVGKAAPTIAERGIAAVPLELNWGREGEIIEVDAVDFLKNSVELLGYDYTDANMKNLREIFSGAKTAIIYRLGTGAKTAENTYATANYPGTRGNDIVISIESSVDESGKYIVKTKVGGVEYDSQTVAAASDLKANMWVTFKSSASLSATTGTSLSGGENGTVSGNDYQTFLDKLEAYSFNILTSDTTEKATKSLIAAYTKRMREEAGVKFQCVLYKYEEADDYGVISVENSVSDSGAKESSLVYWTAGKEAGCALNSSLANTKYDGEYTINADYTSRQLASALEEGKFIFHRQGDEIRVLDDINTYTTTTEEAGEDFKNNQTIRVIDQHAGDVAQIFADKYYGKINNTKVGRNAFRNDVIKILDEYVKLGAVEEYDSEDIKVDIGANKREVTLMEYIQIAETMSKLYATVHIG